MSTESEIARMNAEGFHYTERPGFYRRKADGRRVRAADWPDGDVSWLLDPCPIIAPAIVGTCSAAEFARDFLASPPTELREES